MSQRYTNYDWLLEKLKSANSVDCLVWPFCINTSGYGIVHVRSFRATNLRAHRLAFWHFYGRWPEPHARHTCDNRKCFSPLRILEGTPADNSADMVKRGRQLPMKCPGELNPFAKLTDGKVRLIRQERSSGSLEAHVARKYGVHPKTIRAVVNRTSWSHVV